MKTIPLIWQLFRKDIRNQRAALLLLLAMAVCAKAISAGESDISEVCFLIIADAFYLLSVLIFIRVILLDPPGDFNQFVQTRPIPSISIWISKLMFGVLFGVIPIVFCTLLSTHVTGVDELILIAETSLRAGALLALLLISAIYFRSLAGIVLSFLALGIGLSILMLVILQVIVVIEEYGRYDLLEAFLIFNPWSLCSLSGMFLFISTVLLMLLLRYCRKMFFAPIGAGIIGVIISVLLASRFHLEGVLPETNVLPEVSETGLQWVLPTDINPSLHYRVEQGITHLSAPIGLIGCRNLYFPLTNEHEDTAIVLPLRERIWSLPTQVDYSKEIATGVPVEIAARTLGLKVPDDDPVYIDIFDYRDPIAGNLGVGRIWGTLNISGRFALPYPFLLELKSGSEADFHQTHFSIHHVVRSGPKVSFDLHVDIVPLALRSKEKPWSIFPEGGIQDADIEDRGRVLDEILIFNSTENKFEGEALDESGVEPTSFFLRRHVYHITNFWMDNGKIALFTTRDSLFHVYFDFKNVNLHTVSH